MTTMALGSKSSLGFTVLSCTVQEEDNSRKESCTWLWDDMTIDRRPEERTTLIEYNSVLKEGYKKREQSTFLVQRSPLQTIRAGRLGGEMRDYQLPYSTVLPVPLFMPSRSQAQETLSVRELPSAEIKSKSQMTQSNGLCPEKREVSELLSNLPQITQPTKLQMRVSSLISPPPKLYDTPGH
ncbi:telethonin-like [Bombina bombina]|uniref:telethonin-like n=1 Tax=Bombina bombina TaxID=8345 RepID=UPI00235ABE1E|nr:telethonin-like [Bombina bombina]